ncbi:MAG: hypothetical protein PVH29_04135 [Candidatus Zixiibacteriota bacterium]|jgi:hypothetical protein
MSNGDKPPEPKWLFYVISFIVPLAGIIIGAIYLGKPDPDCKKFGRNAIIAAASAVVACCLCYVLYFLGVFSLVGISGGFSS